MSTLITDPPVTVRAPRNQLVIVAAASIGAIGAAAFISTFVLLSGIRGRLAVQAPLSVTAEMLVALGFVVLAIALPGLAAYTRFPRWALLVSAFGCAFVAATAWASATMGVAVAGVVTDAQWATTSADPEWSNPASVMMLVGALPKMLLCGVGFAALAVTGWRRGVASRGACVLLALAGLVSLLLEPFPPGALLAGIALAWTARSARRSDDQPNPRHL
jgi:hypothetical protein